MSNPADRSEAALEWQVRTNDPDFEAWDEFTAWLEQSPANADAFHALSANEAELLPLVEAIPAAVPAPERRTERRRFAFAAGIAVFAAAGGALLVPRIMPVDHSTGPGEVRIVELGGRDQLVMNGDTRLALAGWDRRTVRLEQGQVLLRLHEAGGEQVHVTSGDLQLVDIGTVFEVSRDGRSSRVLVSEGAVMADPDGAKLRLARGHRLDTEDGATLLQAMPADVASVGSFERGQLAYLDEPIANVVADVRRSTGIDISANPAIGSRRFTGTLSVADIKRDPRSLGPLLGTAVEPSGRGWKLGGKV